MGFQPRCLTWGLDPRETGKRLDRVYLSTSEPTTRALKMGGNKLLLMHFSPEVFSDNINVFVREREKGKERLCLCVRDKEKKCTFTFSIFFSFSHR